MAFADKFHTAEISDIQQGDTVQVALSDITGLKGLSKAEQMHGIEGKVQSCSAKKEVLRVNVTKHGNTTQHAIPFAQIERVAIRGERIGGSSVVGNAAMGTEVNWNAVNRAAK